jgi:hypothetical protein
MNRNYPNQERPHANRAPPEWASNHDWEDSVRTWTSWGTHSRDLLNLARGHAEYSGVLQLLWVDSTCKPQTPPQQNPASVRPCYMYAVDPKRRETFPFSEVYVDNVYVRFPDFPFMPNLGESVWPSESSAGALRLMRPVSARMIAHLDGRWYHPF